MKRFQILFLLCLALSFTFSIFAQDKDTKEVIILQTSDVHSRIEPVNQKGDEYYNKGGFLRRAAFLEQFRKEHKNVLLFDCGDISQGTPYYNMFRGEVEVKLMNEMGYDAMTIGNHEFDFDVDNMERIFKMANFPVVCANYNLDATVLKDIVKPYVVLEKYGLRIGVFGLGTQPEGMIQANKCEGVVYEVCLSHLGIQMDEHLVAGTRNIDVILGGHSHTFMKGPKTYLNMDGKEVPVMHTGKNGVRVGRLDLTLKHK